MSKARRRDRDLLADVREAIERILEYTHELTFDQYVQSRLVQDAVLRNLQVIGEAAKKISDDVKACHPEVPWRRMAGLRDRVVHDYFGVDDQVVWSVVRQDLPPLVDRLTAILQGLPPDEEP